MRTKPTNIVILGGGYSGIMAAVRLAGKTKRLNTSITLVNGLDHFVERPRLHERATGVEMKNKPIADMLRGTKAAFMPGWVTAIDPTRQLVRVETDSGQQQLPYDYLVYALGSRTDRMTVPGVADHAFSLDPYGDLAAPALEKRLIAVKDGRPQIVVIGGGATGVEAAPQIKSAYPDSDISLVTKGRIGAFKGPRIQAHIVDALTEQAITLVENSRVVRVDPERVVLADRELPADIVLWSGGFQVPPLARAAGVRVNQINQIVVDPYLRAESHPNIYAVGDAAFPIEEPGAPMRMSLFTALVSGAQAADNIVADLKGKALRPLSFAWYGQGIALGPKDAVGFGTYPVDVARRPIFRRGLAVSIRNFFVWYLGFVLEMERRIPGFFFWNGRGRYTAQQRRLQRDRAAI